MSFSWTARGPFVATTPGEFSSGKGAHVASAEFLLVLSSLRSEGAHVEKPENAKEKRTAKWRERGRILLLSAGGDGASHIVDVFSPLCWASAQRFIRAAESLASHPQWHCEGAFSERSPLGALASLRFHLRWRKQSPLLVRN